MKIEKTCENCEMNMCGHCGQENQKEMDEKNSCNNWKPNIFYLDYMVKQLPQKLKNEFLDIKRNDRSIEWLIKQFN